MPNPPIPYYYPGCKHRLFAQHCSDRCYPQLSGYESGIWQRITDYLRMTEGESSIRFGRVLMPLHGISSPLIDAINGRYIVTTKNEWGPEPTAGPAQKAVTRWQPLPPGESVHLRFLMPDAGLYRLDLHLRSDGELDGTVTVRIFMADGVLELAHSSLESASISSNAENSF